MRHPSTLLVVRTTLALVMLWAAPFHCLAQPSGGAGQWLEREPLRHSYSAPSEGSTDDRPTNPDNRTGGPPNPLDFVNNDATIPLTGFDAMLALTFVFGTSWLWWRRTRPASRLDR